MFLSSIIAKRGVMLHIQAFANSRFKYGQRDCRVNSSILPFNSKYKYDLVRKVYGKGDKCELADNTPAFLAEKQGCCFFRRMIQL